MNRKSAFWRRVRNVALLLALAGGAMSTSGCIFVRGGHHHHHWDNCD